MEWFIRLSRVVGASIPGAASLVQLQSEINSKDFEERLRSQEDPIGSLDSNVKKVSKILYEALRDQDKTSLDFDEDFYKEYNHTLIVLSNNGYISRTDTLNSKYPLEINLLNHTYILYMAAFFADAKKMDSIIETVDTCPAGKILNAETLSIETDISKYVIRAVFLLYAEKKLGFCTGGMKKLRYQARA